jgi:hypothetical protein
MQIVFRTVQHIALLYTLTLIGCTYEVLPDENACTEIPEIRLVSIKDTQCGNNSGEIIVEADGLAGTPFKFSINDEAENTTGRFENLPAATYKLSVETLEGCFSTLDVEVKNESGLNISLVTLDSDCGSNNGKVTITPIGGEAPYQYKLNEGSFQTENIFEGLSAGEYTILAQDATGCGVSADTDVKGSIDFSSVRTIIQTNCVNASCHGGNVFPDFRDNATIVNNANRIKSRTQSKSMPPASSGKSLSTQEIEDVACWVESGANQ